MGSSFYTLGPHTLQVIWANSHQRSALERCWQALFQMKAASQSAPGNVILLDLTATAEIFTDPVTPQRVFVNGSAWQENGRFWLREGESLLRVESERAQAVGYIAPDFCTLPIVAQRDFFQRLFFLWARRLGGYLLHANALYPSTNVAGTGYLLIGESGTGKTTLSLSLIRAGWRSVGDDSILLDLCGDGVVTAFGVRRGFACTQESAAQWPGWGDLMAAGIPLNRQKSLVDLERVMPGSTSVHCCPRVLLFLTQTGDARTQLRPLDSTRAFLRLIARPGAGILLEPKTTPDLLMLLKTLVEQSHAYQLHLGRDVYTHPRRVSALLESLPVQTERSIYDFRPHPHHTAPTGVDHGCAP